MVQARAAAGDVARNGSLVLPGRAGARMIDEGALGGIEVLQELQLAIARRNEGNPQAADRPCGPRVVDGAVLVGGETLHRDLHLHVGLLAFQREAEAAREDIDGSGIVGTGDADMIDALHFARR